MHTTVREDAAIGFDAGALDLVGSLVLVHHPTPTLAGVRRVLVRGAALDLGRGCGAFGEGALDDPLVSRAHARVELDPGGSLVVTDLGSANGTWVDGARVGAAPLRDGAVVRLGPFVFVAQRAPMTYPLRRSERCPAIAWRTVQLLEALRARVASGASLRLAGARATAWRPYVDLVAEELRRPVPPLDAGSEAPLVMPALTERVEDIPWLARAALRRALGRVPPMDAGLVARLLLASWPEDVDGLERWAEAVSRRPERHERLVWVGEDLALSGGPRPAPGDAPAPWGQVAEGSPAVVVAGDGAWFRVAGEAPVDLRMRFALSRVLRALVAAHRRAPGVALSLEDVIEAGWPGARLVADSGANRVYVAIATLRRLGLRERIERAEGGYRLAPGASIERADTDLGPAAGR